MLLSFIIYEGDVCVGKEQLFIFHSRCTWFQMKAVRGKNCLKGLSLIEYNKSETILIKMVNHTE